VDYQGYAMLRYAAISEYPGLLQAAGLSCSDSSQFLAQKNGPEPEGIKPFIVKIGRDGKIRTCDHLPPECCRKSD